MGLALITGASSGLGPEFAKLFARDGHSVILVARRQNFLDEVAREIRILSPAIEAHVLALDLGQLGAGKKLYEELEARKLNKIDFLVNNAGYGTNGYFVRMPLVKELEMLDLNVRSLLEITGHFLPEMMRKGHGRILQVGSTAGFQPGPFMATYYASKAFVNSFGQALQDELHGSGVTSTVLAPGATKTAFSGTAGMEKSLLFRLGAANSTEVAKAGYYGMMKGKTLVVPGFRNKFLLFSQRFLPRWLVRKVTGFLNRSE